MKVVLLKDVKPQGKKGDLIEVSEGYARNYLFPRKLAVPAESQVLNDIKGKEQAKEFHIAEDKATANALKAKLESKQVVVAKQSGPGNKLYGSVTSNDICDAIKKEFGCDIDKRKVVLPKALKDFGEYEIQIKLYTEITAKLKLLVTSL